MSGLIAPVPVPPQRREPSIVTALRQQIARGASEAVLHRIAGSAADYRRLALEYRLSAAHGAPSPRPRPPVLQPPAPPPPPRIAPWERRARLLRFILGTAEAGLVLPETPDLALSLGSTTLQAEQDLLALVRDSRVRVTSLWCGDRPVRRVELLGRNLFTALPALESARGVPHVQG